MSAILSHPFRILGNGSAATVEQTSDQANAEQIAILATTITDERPLCPGFGISDPTFGRFHTSELLAGIAAFGPSVEITDVQTTWDTDSTQLISVEFD